MIRDSEMLVGQAVGQKFYRENKTESYVTVPPALIVTASDGTTFTLGTEFLGGGWNMEFNVLCNDKDTGEFASRIECRAGVVRIFGQAGWRTWSRSRRTFI